jgi:transcription elongation factor Elf1
MEVDIDYDYPVYEGAGHFTCTKCKMEWSSEIVTRQANLAIIEDCPLCGESNQTDIEIIDPRYR